MLLTLTTHRLHAHNGTTTWDLTIGGVACRGLTEYALIGAHQPKLAAWLWEKHRVRVHAGQQEWEAALLSELDRLGLSAPEQWDERSLVHRFLARVRGLRPAAPIAIVERHGDGYVDIRAAGHLLTLGPATLVSYQKFCAVLANRQVDWAGTTAENHAGTVHSALRSALMADPLEWPPGPIRELLEQAAS